MSAKTTVLSLPSADIFRRRLKADFEARPARLVSWAIYDWTIIITAWFVMADFESTIVSAACILVVASRLQALGALLHDACHVRRRTNSTQWLLVEALAGWPIASTIVAMRYHHIRHHRHSGTAADPYRHRWLERGAMLRWLLVLRGVLLPLWWTLRAVAAPFAYVFPGLRTSYARAFLQDRSGEDLRHSTEVLTCARADLLQLTVQVGALTAAIIAGLPVVQFYLLPWMLAGVLNARRVLVEHATAEIQDSSRANVYESTNDHDLGLVGNFFLYPHNIGLHRTHHMYPTASFEHLRTLTAEIEAARP